jgi:hypothetical protein
MVGSGSVLKGSCGDENALHTNEKGLEDINIAKMVKEKKSPNAARLPA